MAHDTPDPTGRTATVTLVVEVDELEGDTDEDLVLEAIDKIDAGQSPDETTVEYQGGEN